MKPRLTTLLVALWLVLLSVNSIAAQAPAAPNAVGTQAALGTNFVYQGFLNLNGQPANTPHDFEFTLFDALSGGTQIGSPSTATNQPVSNGLFTVMIDFGANAFNGSARFMQIRVRPTGGGEFVALNPRIELAAVPNAQFSTSAGGLQGRPVSGAAPAPSQVLQWDGGQWVPASVAVPVPLNLNGSSEQVLTVDNTNNATSARTIVGTSVQGAGVLGLQGAPASFDWYRAGVAGRSYITNGTGTSGYTDAPNSSGVFGRSDGANGNGVHGIANADGTSAAIWGESSKGWAGYFSGDVHVTGTISAGNKQFKIDHPLDPTNKYLYHTSVESPDMKNIYDGIVTLDANGAAVVELPTYFQALNQEFRYQLTCIGGFAQVYIDQEIANNRFTIAGGKPGLKVSWQVTGIRHDPYAQQNRSPVEEDKSPSDRGTYLYPSAYGQPASRGVDFARNRQSELKQTAQSEGR